MINSKQGIKIANEHVINIINIIAQFVKMGGLIKIKLHTTRSLEKLSAKITTLP